MHIVTALALLLAGFLAYRLACSRPAPQPASPTSSADLRDLLEGTSRVEWPLELNSSADQISLDPALRTPTPQAPTASRSIASKYKKYIAASPLG